MSPWYLLRLCYSVFTCKYLEVPLFFLPAFFLRLRVLNPMMRATQGSVDAASMALVHKWAINLSGGYHHAHRTSGGGFCIFPDITFVVHYIRKWYGLKRFLIVDLDAHQGNGHERDFINDVDVFILDAYNHQIYPGDELAQQAIKEDIVVTRSVKDRAYLELVGSKLRLAVNSFQPEFIIYNAGTDCLDGDPLGGLHISEQGIIDRDELLFRVAYQESKIPILMVLSGGY
mmetsp:Transcript_6210/g.4685  ORF Transcript_6210/g.4685 Transcript_6210/m.4685 type:complete len:230 (+) Transcript_6210:306-995(+)